MPSPFPGMDPYLEAHWLDVHGSLAGEARRALNAGLLPPDLVASIEEHIVVDIRDDFFSPAQRHPYRPDVRVAELHASESPSVATLDAPIILALPTPGIERSVHITEIIERGRERLITAIEFISPTNKSANGLADYLKRRENLRNAGANIVEIDLVRQGDWRALLQPYLAPADALTTYRATIYLAADTNARYYPLPLRQPLRPIPIPLRAQDKPVLLSLQSILTIVYDTGRYPQRLDYHNPLPPPLPPLSPDDAAWANSLFPPTA